MRRRLLLLTIGILLYVLCASVWAQEAMQAGGSISGTLLMLDDKTPHVAIVVQVVKSAPDDKGEPTVIAITLSDENGDYHFAGLPQGQYQVRCHTLNGYFYYQEGKVLQVRSGGQLKAIDFRIAPFKKGTWRNYSTLDGLGYNSVNDICRTPDGVMWFATDSGGVSRYDGKEFVNFTTEDGLVHNIIYTIHRDPDGAMWFGTMWGVSRYDGKEFVNFARWTDERSKAGDGFLGGHVLAIHHDPDGVIWFGTEFGISRYDGKEFSNLTEEDGLVHKLVNAIYQDPDDILWFATGRWGSEGGVSRYDGKEFTNLTTEDGLVHDCVRDIYRDPDGVMWFGTEGGVSRYTPPDSHLAEGESKGGFVNLTTEDGLAHNFVSAIHRDPDGVMWFGTDGGVSRYTPPDSPFSKGRGKGGFVNFTTEDGLPNNRVNVIHRDPDGVMWFGTGNVTSFERGGVSRYDSSEFVNFTVSDGLAGNRVGPIHRDPDGMMWLGTIGGVSRYDGEQFVSFTTEDGLAHNFVFSVHGDPDGVMWFGTVGGVSRYDGKEFTNLTTEDGLAGNRVLAIHRDQDDVMWFGTWGDGASRYDGKEFVNLTKKDGLQHNIVWSIHGTPDGATWFGTWYGGVSRYDGKEFVRFTTEDGLASDYISGIYSDSEGIMWFGTWGGGVSKYDGKRFVNFTTEDGLAKNLVSSIYRDPDGVMWFGTDGGGVSCYDGDVWSSLDTRDGLSGNGVFSIHQDPEEYLWFGTEGGLTRYRRNTTPPKVSIVSVTTDQTYRLKAEESSIPAFTTGTRVTVEYKALDFKTIPEKQQYRNRLCEIDSDWRKPTRETFFDFVFDEPGMYTFQVQAIDRNLNYSEPASLTLEVVSPFYMRAAFLVPVIGIGSILLAALVIFAVAWTMRRRQVHAYEHAAVQELQDARQMQLSLLPDAAPPVAGMEIAGRSVPANTVGGDFFDYLSLPDGKVGIAIADISGKGLKAAMNAVLASGMLYEVVKTEMSCGSVLSVMNTGLCPRTEKHMFTAFSFAILDPDAGVIHWSNAGQPLPLIKRGSAASEVKEDGQLPLGMMPDVRYSDYELRLQPGDTVVFYTDGIIEAENESEEMYGTERLLDAVADIDPSASPEDVIDVILQSVSDFVGTAEQYDDMTIVVIKRL